MPMSAGHVGGMLVGAEGMGYSDVAHRPSPALRFLRTRV